MDLDMLVWMDVSVDWKWMRVGVRVGKSVWVCECERVGEAHHERARSRRVKLERGWMFTDMTTG